MPIPNVESRPTQTTLRRPSRPFLPRIDSSASSRTMGPGELTPASSGPGSAAASPISPGSGRGSPFLHPPRKASGPAVRRPPSPELLSQDCAFPPFPTSKTKKKEQSRNNARGRISDAHSLRTLEQGKQRSVSVGAQKPRIRQGTGDSSRPSTANSSRNPSLSSRAGSRQGSIDEVPPLPPLQPTISLTSSDPGASSKSPEQGSTWPLTPDAPQTRDIVSREASPVPDLTTVNDSDVASPAPSFPVQTTSVETTSPLHSPAADQESREPSYKAKRPPPIANMPINNFVQPTIPGPQLSPISQAPPTPTSTFTRTLTSLFSKKRAPSTSSKKSGLKTPATDGPRFIALSPDPDPQDAPRPDHSAHSSINTEMAYTPPVHGIQEVPGASTGVLLTGQPIMEPSQAQIAQPEDAHEEDHHEDYHSQRNTVQMEEALEQRLAAMTGAPRLSIVEEKADDVKRASADSASSYGSVGFARSTTSSTSFHTFEGHSIGSSISTARTMSSSEDLLVPPSSKFRHFDNVPDSPTDPYLQHGRLAPVQEAESSLESAKDEPIDSYFQAGRLTPVPEMLSSPEIEKGQPTPPIAPPPEPENDESELVASLRQRRPSTPGGIKGICRGCSKPIMSGQKSVSSKDGRLTGKYHKECFVCMTCKEPFATADFYVHEDHPYCAHHYHVLNETLCESCGSGIEGPFLETSNVTGHGAPKKFHPDCLKCATCKVQLGDDYFELSGKVYCEKDAFRMASGPRSPYDTAPSRPSPLNREYVASGAPGQALTAGKFPERRLTKLMTTY